MQELQGQWKRLRQNNANIGFKPGLISLGRLNKQHNLKERSCTEVALTKRTRIQAEKRSSAEIFCLGRRVESKKGLRIDQNILLNIPVKKSASKGGRDHPKERPEAHARKVYLECKFQPKEVLLY
ncbi:hypothetical protein V6N11_002137 [Hibiscus sabdariffa]|uniref:Uncharacterized protein n=1 Tax=Hibiscus sabdariffa TaxID=183260 RepID=A0ABR2QUF7_9ROSI